MKTLPFVLLTLLAAAGPTYAAGSFDCDGIWDAHDHSSPETAVEIATVVSWCHLAIGDIERAHGLAQLVLEHSSEPRLTAEAFLIQARAELMTCDHEAADSLLQTVEKVLQQTDTSPGGAGDADDKSELRIRGFIARRTSISVSFLKRRLAELDIVSVAGTPDRDLDLAAAVKYPKANRWWQTDREIWTDELPGVRTLLPDHCPTFSAAGTPALRYAGRPVAAETAPSESLSCKIPEKMGRRIEFQPQEFEGRLHTKWVLETFPECLRYDPDAILLSPGEISGLLRKHKRVRLVLDRASLGPDGALLSRALPALQGDPNRNDARIAFAGNPNEERKKAIFREQIEKYGALLLTEAGDRLSDVYREMGSAECRLVTLLAGTGDLDSAKEFLDSAISHYLNAVEFSSNGKASPGLMFEAATMARISDMPEKACSLLVRLTQDYPQSQEADDAHMFIASTCGKFSFNRAQDAQSRYSIDEAIRSLEHTVQKSRTERRYMAMFSLAMIYRYQRPDLPKATTLLEQIIDQFNSARAEAWAKEVLDLYLSSCGSGGRCRFDKTARLGANLGNGFLVFDQFKKAVDELAQFVANDKERVDTIHSMADGALGAARTESDRALVRLLVSLEDLSYQVSDDGTDALRTALASWSGRNPAINLELEKNPRITQTAKEVLIGYFNYLIVKAFSAHQSFTCEDNCENPDNQRVYEYLFDQAQRGFRTLAALRESVALGFCYVRVFSYHALVNQKDLDERPAARSQSPRSPLWAKALYHYDRVADSFRRSDYVLDGWDFRGVVLQELVNNQKVKNPNADALKSFQESLKRVESHLKEALQSGQVIGKAEEEYLKHLVEVYLELAGNAHILGHAKQKQRALDDAQTILRELERKSPDSAAFKEAQKSYLDLAAGIYSVSCSGIPACVSEAEQMVALARKSASCATSILARGKAAEYFGKAFAFAKAEEQSEEVCRLLVEQCRSDSLQGSDLDWDATLIKCKSAGATAAMYQGKWDRAISLLDDAMPVCVRKGKGPECTDQLALAKQAAGFGSSAVDLLFDGLQKYGREDQSFGVSSAVSAAAICSFSGDPSCPDKVARMIETVLDRRAKANVKTATTEQERVHAAEWRLGIAYWRNGGDRRALDVWNRCAAKRIDGIADEHQLRCNTRVLIQQLRDISNKLGSGTLAEVKDAFLALDKILSFSVPALERKYAQLVNAAPVMPLGETVAQAYVSAADALTRLEPDVIESQEKARELRSRARSALDTSHAIYSQFLYAASGVSMRRRPEDGSPDFMFYPSPQLDSVAAQASKIPALPAPVSGTAVSALLDGRNTVAAFLVGDWCRRPADQVPRPMAAEACNVLAIAAAVEGNMLLAAALFQKASGLEPMSLGRMNYLQLANAMQDAKTAGDVCRPASSAGLGPLVAIACQPSYSIEKGIAWHNSVCSSRTGNCLGEHGSWERWNTLMNTIWKKMTSLEGSM